jgi:trehalose-6-phosphate synthase
MDLKERRERWQALNKRVHERTAQTWRTCFLADLEKTGITPSPAPKPKRKASPAKAKTTKKKTK